MGPIGPPGAAGPPGPQGPAGPPGSGAYAEDEPGFAGFTVATFSGNIGGRPAAHAACGAEFPGAHLCHAAEYLQSDSAADVPASGAWLDSSTTPDNVFTLHGSPTFGRNIVNSCSNFTSTSGSITGTYLQPSGTIVATGSSCPTLRPLACCNGAPKHLLAGFTSTTYTGAIGSRSAAHAICGVEFAGAHLCHAAEYLRTVSAAPIPIDGAWIDSSVDITNSFTLNGAPSAGRNMANSCSSFTSTSTSITGTVLQTSGNIAASGSVCATPRPIACCH